MVAFVKTRGRQFWRWHVHDMIRPRLFVRPYVIVWYVFLIFLLLFTRLVREYPTLPYGANNLHHTLRFVLRWHEASFWFWCGTQWHDFWFARKIFHSRLIRIVTFFRNLVHLNPPKQLKLFLIQF